MTIFTASSTGSGSVSRVYSAGMKKRTTNFPSPAGCAATGAVIAIVAGPALAWATGAVMAMLAFAWFSPKMNAAIRRNPAERAASSDPSTTVSAARRGAYRRISRSPVRATIS